ncbi:hypothetical protein ACP3V5_06140 [Vibrio maritimus]
MSKERETLTEEKGHSNGRQEFRFKGPVWLAKVMSHLPGFSQPNRNDVIEAYEWFENGVVHVKLTEAESARKVMERARKFYSNYANVLGILVGISIAGLVEWLQVQYPEVKHIKYAHIGAGAATLWIINNIMNEYDRRVEELRALEPAE